MREELLHGTRFLRVLVNRFASDSSGRYLETSGLVDGIDGSSVRWRSVDDHSSGV
jgi:hypothetical protein